ncbi:LacI family DNA-binding transcriptional regulator [Domibacillus indicus]|uniref:LacI family DNA-binding transcriptional regulator n=1 Tax=Domibacillus indicus TaxID=1437523 RepID=UPI0020413B97|nr:LacI family DNA-binding transcriptional regulator [Domibacillus indicus]MCM3788974.1 LacI family DNA-binding transcriptional regulator [Domibacillus indicus]
MRMKKSGRVTLQQVADHAGVSRATASLIVRNSPSISEATRKKVLASMEELGYVYDRIAANLRSQSSSTIGVVVTDFANPYYSEFLTGVHHQLEKEGYTVFLATTFDSDTKQDNLLSTMLEHRVGGVILCPVSDNSPASIGKILQLDVPIVTAVREIPDLHCDYVGINYKKGVEMAIDHLIENGHTRIAFLGGISDSSAWKKRFEGYAAAHKKAGLAVDESLIFQSPVTREGGARTLDTSLKHEAPPTAVFCFNDLVAFGVMQRMRELNLQPGRDLSVVGFDNVLEAETFYPSLTTVEAFPKHIGINAADLLHKRIKDHMRDQERIILEPELFVRASSGKNQL